MFKLCIFNTTSNCFYLTIVFILDALKNKKNYPVILLGQLRPLQPLANLFAISLLYHWSGVLAQLFLLLLEGVYLKVVPVPNKPPPEEPPPLPPLPVPDGGVEEVFTGAGVAGVETGAGAVASFSHFLKLKLIKVYMIMKMQFKKWFLQIEMAGTNAIVACKDKKNPNFQVWGAMSDLGCKNMKKSKKK